MENISNKKKAAIETEESSTNGKIIKMAEVQLTKKPLKERIFPHPLLVVKSNGKESTKQG